ncbi:TSUP family transporter [Microseira sp. BLCC-F43]|uniref:TSUP family transporter n=1 Tax=Microseira sp. BLCC-F43 TaxID=3153602 RepID=UPI0035BAC7DD
MGEKIKVAIQISLGVIVITACSAGAGHAWQGNLLWRERIILGAGGLLGVQVGTQYLPRLTDEVVSLLFRFMLGILCVYIFWQAGNSYKLVIGNWINRILTS